jgi:hypothetical protein
MISPSTSYQIKIHLKINQRNFKMIFLSLTCSYQQQFSLERLHAKQHKYVYLNQFQIIIHKESCLLSPEKEVGFPSLLIQD